MELSEKARHYFKSELEKNNCKTLVVTILGSCCSEGEDIRLEYSTIPGNYEINGISVYFKESEYQPVFDNLLIDVKGEMVIFENVKCPLF